MSRTALMEVRRLAEFLGALPVNDPGRRKLRDVIPWTGKTLESRARKFTTLAPEFQKPNPIPVDQWPTPKKPVYPVWCMGTHQAKPIPFESGRNTLPGLERYAQ